MPDREIVVGLVIIGITWLLFFLAYHAILKIAVWTLTARDALRDRYADSRLQPHAIDIVLLPAWLAIEAFCLVAGIIAGLLLLWMVVDTANNFRDWWHKGNRRT